MQMIYLLEYFIFGFFACFAVLQIALSGRGSNRNIAGWLILVISYVWFFFSRDRNVPTIVEGTQLFLVFSISAILAIATARILVFLEKRK